MRGIAEPSGSRRVKERKKGKVPLHIPPKEKRKKPTPFTKRNVGWPIEGRGEKRGEQDLNRSPTSINQVEKKKGGERVIRLEEKTRR